MYICKYLSLCIHRQREGNKYLSQTLRGASPLCGQMTILGIACAHKVFNGQFLILGIFPGILLELVGNCSGQSGTYSAKQIKKATANKQCHTR